MVTEGDQIVIAAEPVELPNGRLASRSLDNRLGVYVALEVARRVHEAGGGGGPVAGVAAVQEEIGAHGARAMAFGLGRTWPSWSTSLTPPTPRASDAGSSESTASATAR